jgi:serine protease Do
MTLNQTNKTHGVLSARRFALLATTVAGLSGAAFVFAPNISAQFPTAYAQNLSEQAQKAPAPVGFADIVERVKPAVISVRVRVERTSRLNLQESPLQQGSPMDRFFRRFGFPDDLLPEGTPESRARPAPPSPRAQPATGQGSGFFISADGYAVTNNHVVANASSVQVTADDGKTYTARVIGSDQRTDLALIKVDGREDFPYVRFAERAPRIGDWVLAVGNPFGLGGTVTAGIVSANGRDIGAGPYDDFIQIDAPVNRGNSGGPTFDTQGNVIGVNTAIYSPSGGNVGIAFAIPAQTVNAVVNQLRERGSVTRGWIGVQIQPVTAEIADSLSLKEARGALVAEPQAGSPAVKAGIRAGDVIVGVDGKPVRDARELARTIGAMSPGTTVNLAILRDGKQLSLSLTLGELPNQRQASVKPEQTEPKKGAEVPRLGLTLVPASEHPGSGKEGVVVTDVAPNGIAAEHGFRAGDVIMEVAGRRVDSSGDVSTAITEAQAAGKRTVLLRVKSGEGIRFIAVRLGRA